MKIARFSLVFFALLVPTGLAYGSQILVNGGLETGSISPWTTDTRFGSGVWTVTSSGCYSGSYCATDTGNTALDQTFAPVSTSTITDVSFYFNNAIGITAYDFFYSGGGDDEFFVGSEPANTWNFVDATSNLRASGNLTGFEVFGYSGGPNGPTLLDNLSITANAVTPPSPTPEPGSFWLLATGAGALGMGLRSRMRSTPAQQMI